ncbi:MAG: DUF2029 domain-containing protein [Myxococcales bacterium]|nr:DUF2029 domain-containing protein [Myxococcales bacterium]
MSSVEPVHAPGPEDSDRPKPGLGVRDLAPRLMALAGLAAALLPMALRRLIDGDEGYLLMGARLVSEGQRPYADFFSPQTPGVAYAFGAWFSVFGRSWGSARVLAGLVAVATGMFLFEYVWRATRSRGWAFVSLVAFVGSGYVLGWLTIAKTYGLTAMFVMAGAVMLILDRSRWTSFAAGMCFALATETRLYALVAVVAGLVFLWQQRAFAPRGLWRELAGYALGVGAGALFILPSVFASTEALWFGVVEYHGMREAGQNELIGNFRQKWDILRGLVVPERMEGPSDIQFSITLALALVARASRSTPKGFGAAGLAWISLFVVSLLPTPSYPQYFSVVVPLMLADSFAALGQRRLRAVWAPVSILASFFVAMGAAEVARYTTTGINLPTVWTPDRAERWTLKTMRKVGREIDAQGIDEAASWWPGYFVNTKTTIVRGLVNDFGLRVANRVTPEKKQQYHLVSHEDMAGMIQAQKPRLFVEGNWAATPVANLLPAHGYRLSSSHANVRLWVAPPP